MERHRATRRGFIAALAILGLCGASLWRYLTPRISTRRGALKVAKGEVPANGALVFPESRVAIVREDGTWYAMKTVCTHLGCALTVTPRGLACPCHGSLFDPSGKVIRGPADRPLERYKLEEGREFLTVFL